MTAPADDLPPDSRARAWDWSRPALRAAARDGAVLWAGNGGFLRVAEVVPGGVIVSTVFGPQLRTWADLTRAECILRNPSDGAGTNGGGGGAGGPAA